jgi:MGT family glycosyltransferase
MAKIVYFGIPAHGHTNPTLPVVQELVNRGHHVLYYNAESFRAKVEPTGVDFRAYPEPVPSERQISEALHKMIDAALILSEMAERLTPFVLAEVAREQPDLILYDSTSMAGYIAARTHHIPHITFITHFVLDGSRKELDPGAMARYILSAIPHLPRLMGWKRRMARLYGKGIAGGITEYGHISLVFTSREFHPENTFVDERFRFVGPSINANTRDGDFAFDEIGDGPLVYISLGTINNLDRDFYRAAFEAFADYPAQFILAAGKSTDLSQLGAIPANFTVRPYVPQLAVLQRADAFITHGGMNSVHEGLYYGVPEVVVPHQFEQLLNGRRVAETGAGILMSDEHGRVTAAELRTALDKVLNDVTYRENAERIGDTLKAAGGYLRAVAEIEAFIGEKLPAQAG